MSDVSPYAIDPFGPAANPAAYVACEGTERARAELERSLDAGRVAALVGPPGHGKTLLLRLLGGRESERASVAYVPFCPLAPEELFELVLNLLGAPRPGPPRDALLALARERASRGGVVILIDDASALPRETATALAELLEAGQGTLRIALAALEGDRMHEVCRAFGDQLDVVQLAQGLSAHEVHQYVETRLAYAGARPDLVAAFDDDTIGELHQSSQGVPRCLNQAAQDIVRRTAPGNMPRLRDLSRQPGDPARSAGDTPETPATRPIRFDARSARPASPTEPAASSPARESSAAPAEAARTVEPKRPLPRIGDRSRAAEQAGEPIRAGQPLGAPAAGGESPGARVSEPTRPAPGVGATPPPVSRPSATAPPVSPPSATAPPAAPVDEMATPAIYDEPEPPWPGVRRGDAGAPRSEPPAAPSSSEEFAPLPSLRASDAKEASAPTARSSASPASPPASVRLPGPRRAPPAGLRESASRPRVPDPPPFEPGPDHESLGQYRLVSGRLIARDAPILSSEPEPEGVDERGTTLVELMQPDSTHLGEPFAEERGLGVSHPAARRPALPRRAIAATAFAFGIVGVFVWIVGSEAPAPAPELQNAFETTPGAPETWDGLAAEPPAVAPSIAPDSPPGGAPRGESVARAPIPDPAPRPPTAAPAAPAPQTAARPPVAPAPQTAARPPVAPAPQTAARPPVAPAPQTAARPPVAPAPQPAPGNVAISINATPWAVVEIDGREIGVTPLANVEVSVGPHTFRARMPNGAIREQMVYVGPKRRTVVFE